MIGLTFGPYTVLSKLGEGGMGEVYRASDAVLGRDVAIKILPSAFSRDPDRRARFEREARLLASLNHPNIGAIYGFVDTDSGRALVLELVEGPTLDDELRRERSGRAANTGSATGSGPAGAHSSSGKPASQRRGPLGVERALSIARQIAKALDEAHEKGIVHRDLKPANIKLTPDGAVKVLDFGLARASESGDDSARQDLAGTATALPADVSPGHAPGVTEPGIVLGTVAYMSPEQARGRPVDKRTDIWAFGCILYEVFAGVRPFAAETIADTVSAILERDPDWTAIAWAPLPVQHLIRRCLQKDPRQRLRDIGDASIVLDDERPDAAALESPSARPRRGSISIASATLAAIGLVIAAGAGGYWLATRARQPDLATSTRFTVLPPPGTTFYDTVETLSAALSPDGSRFAFLAADTAGRRSIWIRPLNALDAHALPGTEDAASVFWSPDGRSIAFIQGSRLRRLDVDSGGAPVTVCDCAPTGEGIFANWGTKGRAVFASIEGRAVLEVSMTGGQPLEIVTVRRDAGETRIVWPSYLPDGERVIYVAQKQAGGGSIMLAERGQPPRMLFEALSTVQYVEPGYILFVRDSGLFAMPFDARAGEVTGEPFPVGETVRYTYGPARALFTASQTGIVAFNSNQDTFRMQWVSADGRPGATLTSAILRLRISPDARRALFDRLAPGNGANDLHWIDLDRGIEERLTTAPYPEGAGTWLPDGRTAFIAVARGGPPRVYRRDLVSGAEAPVLPAGGLQEPHDVTSDGRYFVYSERNKGQFDIWALPLVEAGEPIAIATGPFSEADARVSPDGTHISYVSFESGPGAVYVAPFLRAGERTLISPAGGRLPRWSRDGRALYYISGKQEMVRVSVTTGSSFQLGRQVPVFSTSAIGAWTNYDIMPDGRFLALVAESVAGTQPWTIRTNWLPPPDAR